MHGIRSPSALSSEKLLWLLGAQHRPPLILLHSEQPKLNRVLAILSAIGLISTALHVQTNKEWCFCYFNLMYVSTCASYSQFKLKKSPLIPQKLMVVVNTLISENQPDA